jgi:tripeptide aminopeptidase
MPARITRPAVLSPEPDLAAAERLVLELLAIPGKSGEEARVAQFVAERLRAAGIAAEQIAFDDAHERTPIRGNTGNLIVKLPGTHRGPRRLLMAHLDTVPICVGTVPERHEERIISGNPATGLGADNRAGVAAVLTAALEIQRQGLPHPPLTLFFPIQEEIGLHGARCVRPKLLGGPKLSFNWDGGMPGRVTIGATGGYRMTIEVRGLASHAGAAPEMGVSAIAIASLAIADLVRDGWHGDVRKGKRRGTSNVGVIAGGDATNVVTERVTLRAEARSHDPAFRAKIIAAFEKAFTRAAKEVRSSLGAAGSVSIDGRLDYEAFRLADDEPCVAAAEAAAKSVGIEPVRAISNGGLDANWLTAHGIPTVTLGCGQLAQHTRQESLDLAAFRQACRMALRLATGT